MSISVLNALKLDTRSGARRRHTVLSSTERYYQRLTSVTVIRVTSHVRHDMI